MSKIEIRKIGITKVSADAIVNAANEHLAPGGGVCGAIFPAIIYRRCYCKRLVNRQRVSI